MDGKYRSLETLFHSDSSPDRYAHAEAEENKRRNDECSLHTGIRIDAGELFMLVPRELAVMTEKVLRVERKVTTLWRSLPGVARWAYIRGLIVGEVFSTNEMEGVHSTRRQIKDALESAESKEPSASTRRFKEFANLYLELTKPGLTFPKAPGDIRSIYDSVVAGELSKKDLPDGRLFRAAAVDIQGAGGRIVHTGVMPEAAIIEMMDKMLGLIASEDLPQVYSAIMSHFVFEYAHPFYDGNGRTGRYLLALFLSEPLSLPTVLSLSRVIAQNKSKYYRAFDSAESKLNHGELTTFVIEMLELVRIAQEQLMDDLASKDRQITEASEKLPLFATAPYALSDQAMHILYQLAQCYLFDSFPDVAIVDVAQEQDMGERTARKYMQELVESGLAQQTGGRPVRIALSIAGAEAFGFNVE